MRCRQPSIKWVNNIKRYTDGYGRRSGSGSGMGIPPPSHATGCSRSTALWHYLYSSASFGWLGLRKNWNDSSGRNHIVTSFVIVTQFAKYFGGGYLYFTNLLSVSSKAQYYFISFLKEGFFRVESSILMHPVPDRGGGVFRSWLT